MIMTTPAGYMMMVKSLVDQGLYSLCRLDQQESLRSVGDVSRQSLDRVLEVNVK